MAKRKINTVANTVAGLEKFRLYAAPRNITMDEATYNVRKFIHNGVESLREAVDAIDHNGKPGWIVNLGGHQRKFVTREGGYLVIQFPAKAMKGADCI